MRNFARSLFVTAGFVIASLVLPTPAQAAWACSAPGMISGSYDGGSSAYIHLQGFNSGGNYSVSRNGTTAKGTTANGTPFTCREKKG